MRNLRALLGLRTEHCVYRPLAALDRSDHPAGPVTAGDRFLSAAWPPESILIQRRSTTREHRPRVFKFVYDHLSAMSF
jgi:hypothetical protein